MNDNNFLHLPNGKEHQNVYFFLFSGTKAYLHDNGNPSWLPTFHLGHDSLNSTVATERFSQLQKRKTQDKTSEADLSSTSTNDKRKCQDDSTSHDQGQNKSICLESEAVLKIHTVQQHQVHLVIQEKESEMSPADRANQSIYSFQYFKRYFKIHFMIQQSLFTQVSQT